MKQSSDVFTLFKAQRFIFICFIVLLNGCAKQPYAWDELEYLQQIRPKTNKKLIAAFGDSLTRGNDLKIDLAYPFLLENHLKSIDCDYEVLNFGINGDTTERALSRIHFVTEIENIKIVILELGANDTAKKVPSDEIKANLQKIIAEFKKRNITVVLCGYELSEAFDVKYREDVKKMYSDLAKENNLIFLPSFMKDVSNKKELMTADNVHPNEKGVEKIAQNVFEIIRPLLDCSK